MKLGRTGMTLVEVLVGATLVGIISIGMLSLVLFYAQNVARSNARQEATELYNLLTLTMSNDVQCLQSLSGAGTYTGTQITLNSLANGAGTVIVNSGARYGAHLWVRSIELEPQVGTPATVQTDIVLGGTSQSLLPYDTVLTVRVTDYTSDYTTSPVPNPTTVKADALAPLTIPLRVYTDPTGNTIRRCLLTLASNQTCNALGGTYEHSVGRCVFPVCGPAQAARDGGDCPTGTGFNCGAVTYFWGLVKPTPPDPTRPPTQLACLCAITCAAPVQSPRY